ncbi:hypothetical protein STEG23_030052, partial [Scotinomys teguina]
TGCSPYQQPASYNIKPGFKGPHKNSDSQFYICNPKAPITSRKIMGIKDTLVGSPVPSHVPIGLHLSVPHSDSPVLDHVLEECYWFIYTMEYYAAEKNNDIMKFAGKWMELENVILSEYNLMEDISSSIFPLDFYLEIVSKS